MFYFLLDGPSISGLGYMKTLSKKSVETYLLATLLISRSDYFLRSIILTLFYCFISYFKLIIKGRLHFNVILKTSLFRVLLPLSFKKFLSL